MNRHASTTAELLVVACIVGLGVVLFVPGMDEVRESYRLDWILGVVTLLAIGGCCISTSAFWQRPILVVLATVACAVAGAFIGWVLIIHSLIFSAIVFVVCAGAIVYFSFFHKREPEHEAE